MPEFPTTKQGLIAWYQEGADSLSEWQPDFDSVPDHVEVELRRMAQALIALVTNAVSLSLANSDKAQPAWELVGELITQTQYAAYSLGAREGLK